MLNNEQRSHLNNGIPCQVKWVDSVSWPTGWMRLDEIESEYVPEVMTSVGLLIHADERALLLAQNWTFHAEPEGRDTVLSHIIQIPISAIVDGPRYLVPEPVTHTKGEFVESVDTDAKVDPGVTNDKNVETLSGLTPREERAIHRKQLEESLAGY